MIYLEILAEDGTGWRLPIPPHCVHITGGMAEFKMPPFSPGHSCTIVGVRLAAPSKVNRGAFATLFTFGMQGVAEIGGSGTITFAGLTLTLENEAVLRQFLGYS